MCKYAILILLLLTNFSVNAQQWRKAVTGSYPTLRDIYFIDNTTGFSVGVAGTILKSTDAGKTWSRKQSGTSIELQDICFVSDLIGYIVGENRTILKTIDGGESWSIDSVTAVPEVKAVIRRIHFEDNNNGWMICSTKSNGWILHTIDGGQNWIMDFASDSTLFDIAFHNGRGVVTGESIANIYYTTDGINWNKATIPENWPGETVYTKNNSDLFSVYMINNFVYSSGWGSSPLMNPSVHVMSTDGGMTWTYMAQEPENKTYSNLYDNYFKDELNGIATGSATNRSVIVKTSDGGHTWKQVYAPFGTTITSIFGAGDNLWMCGESGFLASSSDFGETWNLLTPVLSKILLAIDVTSSGVIYAGGSDGALLKTNNNGETWNFSYVYSGSSITDIYDLCFLNENIGYTAHNRRTVSKTSDGGVSWQTVISDTNSSWTKSNSLHFLSEDVGYVVGIRGQEQDTIYKTTDGGLSWSTRGGLVHKSLNSVRFYDENNGIIVGNNLKALYTRDGGENWYESVFNNFPPDKPKLLKSVAYSGKDLAYAVGAGVLLRSTDGGANWSLLDMEINTTLNSICFHDSYTGYAVGKNYILKTTDAGYTWINIIEASVDQYLYDVDTDDEGFVWISAEEGTIYTNRDKTSNLKYHEFVASFDVMQNYPNPFNPTTQITYSIPEQGLVDIKIFDILGREVTTLFNGIQIAGRHSVVFNADNLSSATYIYRVRYNNCVHTGKMILMK